MLLNPEDAFLCPEGLKIAQGTKLLIMAVLASLHVNYVYQFMSHTDDTALLFESE